MAVLLADRGVPTDKVSLVYNWVRARRGRRCPRPSLARAIGGLRIDDFVVMYAGNHGAAQALSTAGRGFRALPDSDRCHLVLLGDGVEKAPLETRAGDCPRRDALRGAGQPRESMGSLMRAADVSWCRWRTIRCSPVTMPSKVQAVLAAGHPVLVSASGDVARVVRDSGGRHRGAARGRPPALADAVRTLRRCRRVGLRDAGSAWARTTTSTTCREAVGATATRPSSQLCSRHRTRSVTSHARRDSPVTDAGPVLVTGGTGSFGSTMVRRLLMTGVEQVRILSRDEAKQDAMRRDLADGRVKFHVGDVRDPRSVEDAMRRGRHVFHAAALKQVPSCEFFP